MQRILIFLTVLLAAIVLLSQICLVKAEASPHLVKVENTAGIFKIQRKPRTCTELVYS